MLWSDWCFLKSVSSVTQLCPALCNSMDCSTPGFPVHHQLLEPAQTHVLLKLSDTIQSSHLLSFCPLFLLSSIFPSIRVFSNESVLHVRWLKYWSFSFSISPSNSGLPIQDWFPLGLLGWSPCSPRDSQESSPTPQFKSINSLALSFLYKSNSHSYTWLLEKP